MVGEIGVESATQHPHSEPRITGADCVAEWQPRAAHQPLSRPVTSRRCTHNSRLVDFLRLGLARETASTTVFKSQFSFYGRQSFIQGIQCGQAQLIEEDLMTRRQGHLEEL